MHYQIWWSATARKNYLSIIAYLQDKWTLRETKNFAERTSETLERIAKNPLLYQYSKENDVYRCVLTKQVTLYYRIKAQRIELLTFWDNRRDPKVLSH